MQKHLVVLTGPTGVGKTDLSIEIAKYFNTPIISCDSRQFFKELNIGTAKPSEEQLKKVLHFFIGHISIFDYYNVSMFEMDVLKVLDDIFERQDFALMVGGSGLYIDAVCKGIDDLPDFDEKLRNSLIKKAEDEGVESLRFELKRLDPEYYKVVDLRNKNRVLRAVEVCMMTGKPYSSFRTNKEKSRNFNIIKIGLNCERELLYNRINNRVDAMIREGLIEEATSFYENRNLNSLNTVGYKEIFDYLENKISLEKAIELIKRNTRHYAKRQITWFNRYEDLVWAEPNDLSKIIDIINQKSGN